jgi:hypothetical protein
MTSTPIIVVLTAAIASLASTDRTGMPGPGQRSEGIVAQPGDIASGVLITDTVGELRLKTAPCDENSTVVVFYAEYRKSKIGQVTCGDQVLDRYQVEKK